MAVALNAQREDRGLGDVHAFSRESTPPRGLSPTRSGGKGLLVVCHGHEAKQLAGIGRLYIYVGAGGEIMFDPFQIRCWEILENNKARNQEH